MQARDLAQVNAGKILMNQLQVNYTVVTKRLLGAIQAGQGRGAQLLAFADALQRGNLNLLMLSRKHRTESGSKMLPGSRSFKKYGIVTQY